MIQAKNFHLLINFNFEMLLLVTTVVNVLKSQMTENPKLKSHILIKFYK